MKKKRYRRKRVINAQLPVTPVTPVTECLPEVGQVGRRGCLSPPLAVCFGGHPAAVGYNPSPTAPCTPYCRHHAVARLARTGLIPASWQPKPRTRSGGRYGQPRRSLALPKTCPPSPGRRSPAHRGPGEVRSAKSARPARRRRLGPLGPLGLMCRLTALTRRCFPHHHTAPVTRHTAPYPRTLPTTRHNAHGSRARARAGAGAGAGGRSLLTGEVCSARAKLTRSAKSARPAHRPAPRGAPTHRRRFTLEQALGIE